MGGGTGPADGTRATTCTPAPVQMKLMLESTDDLPLNFGFTGKVFFFVNNSSDLYMFKHLALHSRLDYVLIPVAMCVRVCVHLLLCMCVFVYSVSVFYSRKLFMHVCLAHVFVPLASLGKWFQT